MIFSQLENEKNFTSDPSRYESKTVISLRLAVEEWKKLLGAQNVIHENIPPKYTENTICVKKSPKAVLMLRNTEDLCNAMQIAQKYAVSVYPISTGNNWGYGSSCATSDDSVIFDLSAMDKIISFDDESGVVTVQPGVTQQMLYDFLQANGSDYLVPVTGAGPHCSLLGNALERGYGITPKTDHFESVTNLEAVLPDGSLYKSNFIENGGEKISQLHKWGLGPYLDGIFTQSNMGIVTQVSIELQKKPEQIEFFCFQVKDTKQLPEAVEKIRVMLERAGHNLSGINILNGERVLSMSSDYPYEEILNVGRDVTMKKIMKKFNITPWTCVGAIYGTKHISKAVKKELKKGFRPVATRLVFLDRTKINFVKSVYNKLPFKISSVTNFIEKVDSTLQILEGKPSRVALPLAYWKNKAKKYDEKNMNPNPALDNCGLTWFTPLIPLKSKDICNYTEIVRRVCIKHNIEPLITITTLSEKVADSSVPILFDKNDPVDVENARICYLELFEECKANGYLPYRMAINNMHLATNEKTAYWSAVETIKKAIDPNNILSPGRYCPEFE